MTELITTIITQEDAQARKKLIAGLEAVQAEQKKLSVALAKGEVTNKQYADSFAKLNKEASTLKKALTPLERDFKAQQKAIEAAEKATRDQASAFKDAGQAADDLDTRLSRLDESFSKVSNQVGQAGDIESSVRALGGGIGAAGGGAGQQIEGAVSVLAEGFAALEAAPRLKTAISGLPDIAEKAADSLGLSGMSGSIQQLIPGLSGGQAALLGLSAAALGITAVIGAVSLAVQQWNKHLEQVRAAQEARNQALLDEVDRQNEIQRLQQAGDTEQIVSNFDASFQAVADGADRVRTLQEEYESLGGATDTFQERLNEFGRWFPVTAVTVRAATDADRERRVAVKEALDAEIAAQAERQAAFSDYETAVGQISQTELDRIKYTEDLEAIEQSITSTTNERVQAEQQLEQGLQRLTQLESQRTGLIEQRAQAERFADEQSALEAKFSAEDQIAQEQALRDNLTQIANDSLERIAAIDTEIGNLRVEREQALADVISGGQEKLDKINGDYFKKTLADTRKFQKETERLEEDNKQARLKLIADITDRLNQAEADNNVLAFLQAQTEGAKQLKEQAQSSGEAERRRAEDFAIAQEQAAEAQAQRVAETLASIETEKQKVIEAFNERRAELVATREAEKVAAQEAQNQAIENYRAQEEREAQQAERQAERDALRKQQEEERFQQSLDAIEKQKQAQLAANNEIRVSINNLTTLAGNLQSRIAAANAQAQSSSSQSSSSSSGSPFSSQSYSDRARAERNGFTAFASGGIADRPTVGLIAEVPGMSEAVIPFRKSEGIEPALARHGLGGGGKPSITLAPVFNNTIGDIASKSEVVEANRMTFQQLIILVENALAGNA